MTRRLPFLTALALLALPGAAHAAYAPQLQIKIEPPTPGGTPKITSLITQRAGETANKKVVVTFGRGFFAAPNASQLTPCTPQDEAKRACPPQTQIGTARATAGPINLSGTVHLGTAVNNQIKIIVFLQDGLGLVKQTVVGLSTLTPNLEVQTTFDNLPDTTTNSFELVFTGGNRALITNPDICGRYTITGSFTSHRNESFVSRAPAEITGCPDEEPRITAVVIKPARVQQGGTAELSFNLSENVPVTVTTTRLATARRSAAVRIHGKPGRNRIRGIGRGLRPGRYRIALSAIDAKGQRGRATKILTVVAPTTRRAR